MDSKGKSSAVEYLVLIDPVFSEGTLGGAKRRYFSEREIYDGSGDYVPIFFSTKEEAEKAIEKEERGIYVLSHGEMGRPQYTVVADDDLPPDCIPASGLAGSDETEIDLEDIPLEVREEVSRLNVEYIGDRGGYELWESSLDHKDTEYIIRYLVNPGAVQLAECDMSRIDWSGECYYRSDIY